MTHPARKPLSFRHALMGAAALALAALVAMAALMAMAMAEADRLLDRLGRSQDQMTRVTRIEADVNALLLSTYDDANVFSQVRAMSEIEAQLSEYNRTITEELQSLDNDQATMDAQMREALEANELTRIVMELGQAMAAVRQSFAVPAQADTAEQRRALHTLAEQIEAREDAEARAALALMRQLKNRTMFAGIGIFSLFALLTAAGGWGMLGRMARPLQLLEEAAARVGSGAPPPADAPEPGGFAEIQHVAHAFNRLEEEVTAQRRALARQNEDLEAQVAQRTAEIEASRARLAEIDRTRREFFSKVSHELRTPATVIRGEAEVALRDPDAPPEELREALEHIAANSAFLQRRLNDLLSLARAEDGRITLRREPIRLDRLLNDVVALAEPYTRSSGLKLIGDGLERPDLVIEGDSSWLQQALLVLVDNAAKFAGASPAVRLSLRADNDIATIGVADGGPGVDPDALPFLFDNFYQAPANAGPRGAGVGLSVTRWVVEQHGGAVSARNVEGQGLLIELRLPMAA